jgi:hypothetical protein
MVYRYYDAREDDYATSTRMATRAKIKQIGREIIPGTKTEIDDKHLGGGWTAKGFVERVAADQMHQTRSRHDGAVSQEAAPLEACRLLRVTQFTRARGPCRSLHARIERVARGRWYLCAV